MAALDFYMRAQRPTCGYGDAMPAGELDDHLWGGLQRLMFERERDEVAEELRLMTRVADFDQLLRRTRARLAQPIPRAPDAPAAVHPTALDQAQNVEAAEGWASIERDTARLAEPLLRRENITGQSMQLLGLSGLGIFNSRIAALVHTVEVRRRLHSEAARAAVAATDPERCRAPSPQSSSGTDNGGSGAHQDHRTPADRAASPTASLERGRSLSPHGAPPASSADEDGMDRVSQPCHSPAPGTDQSVRDAGLLRCHERMSSSTMQYRPSDEPPSSDSSSDGDAALSSSTDSSAPDDPGAGGVPATPLWRVNSAELAAFTAATTPVDGQPQLHFQESVTALLRAGHRARESIADAAANPWGGNGRGAATPVAHTPPRRHHYAGRRCPDHRDTRAARLGCRPTCASQRRGCHATHPCAALPGVRAGGRDPRRLPAKRRRVLGGPRPLSSHG